MDHHNESGSFGYDNGNSSGRGYYHCQGTGDGKGTGKGDIHGYGYGCSSSCNIKDIRSSNGGGIYDGRGLTNGSGYGHGKNKVETEVWIIRNLSKVDLPLMIGATVTREGKDLLEFLLRKGK